jgi:hypothetical protein
MTYEVTFVGGPRDGDVERQNVLFGKGILDDGYYVPDMGSRTVDGEVTRVSATWASKESGNDLWP